MKGCGNVNHQLTTTDSINNRLRDFDIDLYHYLYNQPHGHLFDPLMYKFYMSSLTMHDDYSTMQFENARISRYIDLYRDVFIEQDYHHTIVDEFLNLIYDFALTIETESIGEAGLPFEHQHYDIQDIIDNSAVESYLDYALRVIEYTMHAWDLQNFSYVYDGENKNPMFRDVW